MASQTTRHTRHRAWLAIAVAALLGAVAGPSGPAGAADPDAFTPILQSVLAAPEPVLGSDGKYHLVYEVRALNASSLPWTVRSVTVRGAGAGRPLAGWSGAGVRDVLVSLADHQPTDRLEPGQAGLLYLTFAVASKRVLPHRLTHVLSLGNASSPLQGPPAVTETGGATRVVTRPPAVLGPPLAGPRWVAADGCCTAPRHVRATQAYGGSLYTAQRFAIDWEQLDAQGRLFTGDKRRLENWTGYRARVLAVADGTIVHAVNDQPDQVPGETPTGVTPVTADGNGVILRLNDGRYVFYAHMIAGSLTVKPGDRVHRGQRLGLLGNSGNSTAPHLHLHVIDRNAILGANGLPYVFTRFDVTGRIASTDAFNHAEATGEPAQLGPVRTGPRRRALPLDQVIVTWR